VLQVCPAGTYSTGQSSFCIPCRPGYFAPAGAGACSPCKPGTYAPKPSAASCLLCTKGFQCPTNAMAAVGPCPAGTFGNQEGQRSCTACPVNTRSAGGGRSGAPVAVMTCAKWWVLSQHFITRWLAVAVALPAVCQLMPLGVVAATNNCCRLSAA